uniref:Protein phosphatase 6 regulatory subunit 2 n=1 Tax=Sphenodon punctatus TaxID=8508 RepID=A0A8D0GMM4_SPHPU
MRTSCPKLNPDKTEVVMVGRSEGVKAPIIDGVHPSLFRSLGGHLDSQLCLDDQVAAVVKSTFGKLHLIRSLRPYISGSDLRQSNASQTLCDIIRLSRDQGNQLQEIAEPDPLLAALESQECVEQLLKNMFDGDQTENCLVNGTQVLLTLLETRRVEGLMDSFSQGIERSYTVNSSILNGIEPWLKDFHQLLLNPPKKTSILTTIGVLEEPLGNARLHGARLISALLHTNTPNINQELCRLNTMDVLLDLFFKYTWNNFLHFQVELCIVAILSHSLHEDKTNDLENKMKVLESSETPEKLETLETSTENIMVTHLFQKCCLVQRTLDAWETNDRIQAECGMRRGNMGHLTRIANAVVQNMEKGPVQNQISEFIKGNLPEDCRGRWESFVEETLTETNRRNTVDLVSTHHLHSSSEDEDIESAFPSELSLQQAFSEYQIQQMTASFVDQFGFNDEEFVFFCVLGSGWTAVFEPVNSKPPTPCVAMDVGSSVWDSAAPETTASEEKGWAKFTDFQPFCCSFPIIFIIVSCLLFSLSVSASSPCVWNVCVARKAPLVASDSSSSGGSDSEEEEEKTDIITETISTGSGQETIKLTMDAKNEKAVFTRCERNCLGWGRNGSVAHRSAIQT